MTSYYSRFGANEFLSPFAEEMIVPVSWFTVPQPQIVDHVAGKVGLLHDEKVRFAPAISMSHLKAKFERVTGREVTFDVESYLRAILRLPRN